MKIKKRKLFQILPVIFVFLSSLAGCTKNPPAVVQDTPESGKTQVVQTAQKTSVQLVSAPTVTFTPLPSSTPTATPIPLPPSGDWIISTKTVDDLRLEYQTKPGIVGVIWDAAWSPDGTFLAVTGSSGAALLNASDLSLARVLDTHALYIDLAFSANGERLAAASGISDRVQVWDMGTDQSWQFETAGFLIALSPDGKTLAAAQDIPQMDDQGYPLPVKTIIQVYDVENQTLIRTLQYFTTFTDWNMSDYDTIGLFFSADGKSLHTVNGYGDIHAWYLPNGALLGNITNQDTRSRLSTGTCYVDGDSGATFAVACVIGYLDPPCTEDMPGCIPNFVQRIDLSIWDTAAYRRVHFRSIKDVDDYFLNLVYDPAAKETRLLYAQKMEIWTTRYSTTPDGLLSGDAITEWTQASTTGGTVPLLKMSPSGDRIAITRDARLAILDSEMNSALASYVEEISSIRSTAVGWDGTRMILAEGLSDGTIQLIDTASGDQMSIIEKAHTGAVTNLGFDGVNRVWISGGEDKLLRLWTVGGEPAGEIKPSPADGTFEYYDRTVLRSFAGVFAFSTESKNAQGNFGEKIVFRDLKTNEFSSIEAGYHSHVALSLNGDWLAFGRDSSIQLFDRVRGTMLREFTLPTDYSTIYGVALSPDGSLLAGVIDQTLVVWNSNSRQTILAHEFPYSLSRVDFSADGCLIAVGDINGEVYLLDIARGEILRRWQAHSGKILSLSFSEDGRILSTMGADGGIHLYGQEGVLGLPSGNPPQLTCQLASIPVTSTPVVATASFTPEPPTITPTLVEFFRTLSLTDPHLVGEDVYQMQQRLVELGYEPGIPDGDFGKKTDQAVRDFQQCNGLVVDGVVGPITWNQLFHLSAQRNCR